MQAHPWCVKIGTHLPIWFIFTSGHDFNSGQHIWRPAANDDVYSIILEWGGVIDIFNELFIEYSDTYHISFSYNFLSKAVTVHPASNTDTGLWVRFSLVCSRRLLRHWIELRLSHTTHVKNLLFLLYSGVGERYRTEYWEILVFVEIWEDMWVKYSSEEIWGREDAKA